MSINSITVHLSSPKDVNYWDTIQKALEERLGLSNNSIEVVFTSKHPNLKSVYFTYGEVCEDDEDDNEVLGEMQMAVEFFAADEMSLLLYDTNEHLLDVKFIYDYEPQLYTAYEVEKLQESLDIPDCGQLTDEKLKDWVRSKYPNKTIN